MKHRSIKKLIYFDDAVHLTAEVVSMVQKLTLQLQNSGSEKKQATSQVFNRPGVAGAVSQTKLG